MVKKGKDKEELLSLLERVDETIAIDSLLRKGETLTVNVVKGSNGEYYWSASGETKGDGKCLLKGSGYGTFFMAVSDEEKQLEKSGYTILCISESEPEVEWDGSVDVTFFELVPSAPYYIHNGTACFETYSTKMSRDDYVVCRETGIAFRSGDTIYPIMEDSIDAITRFFHCASAFKERSKEFPLGTAIVLANSAASVTKVRFMTERNNGNVKPIRTVYGSSFQYISQKSFFEALFNIAARHGIFYIRRWAVSREETRVEFYFSYSNLSVVVSTSDMASKKMTISYYYEICRRGKILVCEDRFGHYKNFDTSLIEKSFSSALEEFKKFKNNYLFLLNKRVEVEADDLHEIRRLLGKKRLKEIEVEPCAGDFKQVYLGMIKKISASSLPTSTLYALYREYQKIFVRLYEHESRGRRVLVKPEGNFRHFTGSIQGGAHELSEHKPDETDIKKTG